MTQEEKQLLLKDLCARQPYGVKFKAENEDSPIELHYVRDEDVYGRIYSNLPYWVVIIKPYLRSMSSMTEEEAKEIAILDGIQVKDILSIKITDEYIDFVVDDGLVNTEIKRFWYDEIVSSIKIFDWLNKHNFDYRDLIPKGLALEAPNNMYKI
jgi:hypothetical protein